MTGQPNRQEDWSPCEPGQLAGLASNLDRQKQPSALLRAGQAMAICALLVFTAGLLVNSFNDAKAAALACEEVAGHLDAYAQQQCPPELNARIEAHLAHCKICREALAQLQKDLNAQRLAPQSPGAVLVSTR